MKDEENVPLGKFKQKILNCFCILKVTEERSRTRSRIHYSDVRIRGSGSAPKCHGSHTLPKRQCTWKFWPGGGKLTNFGSSSFFNTSPSTGIT